MSTPSKKSPEIEKFAEETFSRSSSIESDTCESCKGPAKEFRNDLSQKEYTISGFCQKCQDEVFGVD